jgi:hypothetical protein
MQNGIVRKITPQIGEQAGSVASTSGRWGRLQIIVCATILTASSYLNPVEKDDGLYWRGPGKSFWEVTTRRRRLDQATALRGFTAGVPPTREFRISRKLRGMCVNFFWLIPVDAGRTPS